MGACIYRKRDIIMSEEKKHLGVSAEDYKEPNCPFVSDFYEGGPAVEPIPVKRVIEKLDELLYDKNDVAGARRHLEYWARAAREGNDLRGLLTVENELMGFYRQNGTKEDAYLAAAHALEILPLLKMEETVSGATTYLNCATVYKVFGEPEKAADNYERAKKIYENNLDKSDRRLAGLYNNYALALCDLSRYDEAERLYGLALDIVENDAGQKLEAAITYLNLADLYYAKLGAERSDNDVFKYLDMAESVFDDESVPRDGYYAYVCTKSAPTFKYYGWFITAQNLTERAKAIYERS